MKDIVITLPEKLWYFICSGRKKIELRKSIPVEFDIEVNKCWVVQKGTSRIVGYFYIDSFREDSEYMQQIDVIAKAAAVSVQFVRSYYHGCPKARIWNIGPVYQCCGQYDRFDVFGMKYNPQSFVYVGEPMHEVYRHQVQ